MSEERPRPAIQSVRDWADRQILQSLEHLRIEPEHFVDPVKQEYLETLLHQVMQTTGIPSPMMAAAALTNSDITPADLEALRRELDRQPRVPVYPVIADRPDPRGPGEVARTQFAGGTLLSVRFPGFGGMRGVELDRPRIRAADYQDWLEDIKYAKLPPLTKCAAEVTPNFLEG